MPNRISLDELKKVANIVRKAGGGNPIDALMPSVPSDPTTCLIAKNLNFNCEVRGLDIEEYKQHAPHNPEAWSMRVPTREIARKISRATGWKMFDSRVFRTPYLVSEDEGNRWALVLPDEVGQVAADFDAMGELWHEVLREAKYRPVGMTREAFIKEYISINLSTDERRLLVELAPYIQVSKDEAYNLASFVNPDGSIVI